MKKLLSLVLALMMFAVPCLAESEIGGADGVTCMFVGEETISGESIVADAIAAGRRVTMTFSIPEVSGIETGSPEVDAAVVDFLKSLGMRVVMQGDEYDMGLTLSQKDVLTLGWVVNGNDLYVKSNLIGGTIVFSAPEIEPIINRLLDMFVTMEAMTAEEAEEIKTQLPVMLEQVKMAFEQSANASLTPEDLLAMDYSAFDPVIGAILADIEEVTDITVPRMCDQATHGIRLSMDEEEFKNILRACIQFIKDNPKLLNMIAAEGGYVTEEARQAEWAANGHLYQQFGFYESEEEYYAANPTCLEAMDQWLAELNETQLLGGDFVTTIYLNDAEEVVYLTSVLPMYTETDSVFESDEANGETEILNVVYSRQTVAQGVSHVVNIDVDGEGVTIDLLAQENAGTVRMIRSEDQETGVTINWKNDNGAIKGDFTTNDEIGVAGTFAWSHVADENQFKTEIAFEMYSVESYLEANHDETGHALSLTYLCDYARNGVDFSGKEVVTFAFDQVKTVFDIDIGTSDPTDSIMSGSVIRPAELDDAAFANWFASAYNAVNSWMGNAIMALPESVLMVILSQGNAGY